MPKKLTKSERSKLAHAADVQRAAIDRWDYSSYGKDAHAIRAADLAYLAKLEHAAATGEPVWERAAAE